MTGDATRDTEPTPHDFESLPVDEYAAARAERERRQRERMDAAYEKAKAENCHHCHDDPPRCHVCPMCGREPT